MRPPGHGDVIAAARVLRMLPARFRRCCLARLLAEARAADDWCLARGGLHPCWGDGSLMAAALRRGEVPDFGPRDHDYCACLALVAETLAGACQPRAQEMQSDAAGSSVSRSGAIASPHSWQ